MKRTLFAAALSVIVVTVSAGLAAGAPDKSSPKPKSAMKEDMSSADTSVSGKVVETMNSGGYTYVCLENKGKKTWVAVPEMKVAKGQTISFEPGQVMPNFQSKSLNRTFDTIVFSSGPAASSAPHAMAESHGGSKAAAPKVVTDVKVSKATGANAFTVGEIFEKRSQLNNKSVVVRAKVVKVSTGIMNMNWLHLQDGTGKPANDPAKATNDLVVTTLDTANVGDEVTVKGTVIKDKDFTSGYKYAVIIEKASVQH